MNVPTTSFIGGMMFPQASPKPAREPGGGDFMSMFDRLDRLRSAAQSLPGGRSVEPVAASRGTDAQAVTSRAGERLERPGAADRHDDRPDRADRVSDHEHEDEDDDRDDVGRSDRARQHRQDADDQQPSDAEDQLPADVAVLPSPRKSDAGSADSAEVPAGVAQMMTSEPKRDAAAIHAMRMASSNASAEDSDDAAKPAQLWLQSLAKPGNADPARGSISQSPAQTLEATQVSVKLAPVPTVAVEAPSAALQTLVEGAGRTPGASTPTAAPQAMPAPAPEIDPTIARVARGLQTAMQQNGGTVTMRLNPPELGVLRIELQVNNGMANVRFHAEQEGARHLLNQQMHTLRLALEHQGLSVDRMEVQTLGQGSARDAGLGQTQDDGRSRGQFSRQSGQQQDAESSSRDASQPRSFVEEFLDAVA